MKQVKLHGTAYVVSSDEDTPDEDFGAECRVPPGKDFSVPAKEARQFVRRQANDGAVPNRGKHKKNRRGNESSPADENINPPRPGGPVPHETRKGKRGMQCMYSTIVSK